VFNNAGVADGSADLTFDDATGTLISKNVKLGVEIVSYAASVQLDFDEEGFKTISLTGDISLTTGNRASGKSMAVRFVADGSNRSFTFPAWVFVGSAPTQIVASKTGVLALTCFGSAESDIVAAYAEEA
jgi:hypothetical protein